MSIPSKGAEDVRYEGGCCVMGTESWAGGFGAHAGFAFGGGFLMVAVEESQCREHACFVVLLRVSSFMKDGVWSDSDGWASGWFLGSIGSVSMLLRGRMMTTGCSSSSCL
jgi:hypothetical protein